MQVAQGQFVVRVFAFVQTAKTYSYLTYTKCI